MKLGRLVLIDIEGEYAGYFKRIDEEKYKHIAGARVDKEGRLIHIFFEPCGAKYLVESLKDDPLFEEEVHLVVFSLDGKKIKEKLHEFNGTLYDALLIAASDGAKYDV